eukprot:Hpha_TRINITY_DN14637_c0_g1::TRINITY_DN14637_c0_g1_i1::g.47838::m.47838
MLVRCTMGRHATVALLCWLPLVLPLVAATPCGTSGGCKPWLWTEQPGKSGSCAISDGMDMRVVLGWSGALTELAGGRRVPTQLRLTCFASPCAEVVPGVYQLQGVQINGFPVWARGDGNITNFTASATLYSSDGLWVVTAGDETVQISAGKHLDALPHELPGGWEGDVFVEEVVQSGTPLTGFGDFAEQYKTYFFCTTVDSFTAITLKGSARALATTTGKEMQAAVYGAGRSGTPRVPTEGMESRVTVWDPNHPKCPRGAVADFLVYNVTLRDGRFAYLGGDPIGNGFVPTCEGTGVDALCGFDPESVCIGSGNSYNCARCYTPSTTGDATSPTDVDISIFVTYYGTDANGDNLLSGSSNPINFREFAVSNVYADLRGSVTDLTSIF